ncbi:MAG TPA: hypothetical protein VMU53_05760 [Candidatus Sulfotelmatobacter sp.]|nr:hypothetical protein [Candidatus Sulfotelmatobacter sp.]
MKHVNKLLLLGSAWLLVGGLLGAQAPPGPMTTPPPDPNAPAPPPPPKKVEVQPRKSIMGYWVFNKDESDDGRAKLNQSRQTDNSNRGNGNGGYGGPRVYGPWPGGGGGYGGPRPQGDTSDTMGDFVNPPREIKFSQQLENDPEVLLADDRDHRTQFFTDGRKLEKQKDSDDKQVAARWDDKKLVTDEKGAHGGKVSRTFELSPDGKQLIETVHVTDSKGNHPVNVQYVYDAVDQVDPYSRLH